MSSIVKVCLLSGVLSVGLACRAPAGDGPEKPSARALELSQNLLIVDTHVDVPYRLDEAMRDISVSAPDLNFDYPRARAGGLDVPFLSIYVPASHEETADAGQVADRLIDMVDGILADHPEQFTKITSVAGARTVLGTGKIGFAMGLENGAPIEGKLENLRHYFDRGIRYITLTHSRNNHICDSSYAEEREWNGLSPFGRELVGEMNRLGMMIDVSHVSDQAFEQVIELSRAPVIASHSSCRQFTPDFERNMSDEMIRKLAGNGGVIQINFGSMFVRDDARRQSSAYWEQRQAYLDEHQFDDDGPEAEEFAQQFFKESPRVFADISDVVDHIDHVVGLVGEDHVGFGSDFDGVGDSLPTGLKDVSYFPYLIDELLRRGYSEAAIEKICAGNLLRVWSAVERLAVE